MSKVKLDNDTWDLSGQIGSGGFGKVYKAVNGRGEIGALKFIPKDSGAARDLLAVDLSNIENIVHIIDQGESEESYIIAMPLADKSLQDYLDENSGIISLDDAIKVAKDVATTLREITGRVVHRDIKPHNILLLNGSWRLTDFGISRYAEATTASDTQKFALSPPYAAPERWEAKRSTAATDIYSLGVVLYEALTGSKPFNGPDLEDYRDQHLHEDPGRVQGVPLVIADLIKESLYKTPESRPTAAAFINRLEAIDENIPGSGLSALQHANQQQVDNQMTEQQAETVRREEQDRRSALFNTAKQELESVGENLKAAITTAAPTAELFDAPQYDVAWRIKLGSAALDFNRIEKHDKDDWGDWEHPNLDVIAYSSIDISMPINQFGYEGRGHSLWYCDAQNRGEYGWYEVAFMVSPFIARSMQGSNGGVRDPFQLNPSEGSAKALWRGTAEWQLARPFVLLKDGSTDEFIDRWGGYLAAASTGSLNRPSTMPEMKTEGSWAY